MRLLIALLVLSGPVSVFQARAQTETAKLPELVARHHFAGTEAIHAGPGGEMLKAVLGLSATADVRDHALRKWAGHIGGMESGEEGRAELFNLLRGIVVDLLKTESYSEWRRDGDELEWIFAVRLEAGRVESWRDRLKELSSFPWFKHFPGGRTAVTEYLEPWLVIASGRSVFSDHPVVENLKANGRPASLPEGSWLRFETDLAQVPALGRGRESQPRLDLTFRGQGDTARTEASFLFPEAREWKVESWKIPFESIRDPQNSLISLTALQGLGPLLNHPSLVRLGVKAPPNQIFSWSNFPLEFHAAVPVSNATGVIKRIEKDIAPLLNRELARISLGAIQPVTNRVEVQWKGLPLMLPFVRAISDSGHEFAQFGVLPVEKRADSPAPPSELFEQLTTRDNLLYYHWEYTEGQIGQLHFYLRLAPMFLQQSFGGPQALGHHWVEAIKEKLGNTVTEVSVVSPRELLLVRSSEIGFTAAELIALSRWIDSETFPSLRLRDHFQLRVPPSP